MTKRNRPSPDPRGARPAVARRPAEPARGQHSPADLLGALFDAERSVRRIHRDLGRADRGALMSALTSALSSALKEQDEREASIRLVCLAQVLGQLSGDQVVDRLIDILASEAAEARQLAGDALTEMAFERFKEVALGVERALERLPVDSPARLELPFLLLEVPEPGVAKLLEKMLKQSDPEAIVAAIEACVELGDPAMAEAIAPLRNDKRRVEIEDDQGEVEQAELGQLASEAHDMLQGG